MTDYVVNFKKISPQMGDLQKVNNAQSPFILEVKAIIIIIFNILFGVMLLIFPVIFAFILFMIVINIASFHLHDCHNHLMIIIIIIIDVQGLESASTYEVFVEAVNEYGIGEPSSR